VAALYGLTDAYVDANLSDFGAEPPLGREWDTSPGSVGGGALKVGVAFRF
jgi:hypothetical protein